MGLGRLGLAVADVATGFTPAGFLKQFWKPLLFALVLGLAVFFIWRWDSNRLAAEYTRGKTEENQRLTAKANAINQKIAALNGKIVGYIRSRNDEANSLTNAAADSLLRNGPGRARCDTPAFPALSSGHQPSPGSADGAVGRVPYPEWATLIGVPFNDTVYFARDHDLNLNEVKSCRAAWQQLSDAWTKAQASGKEDKGEGR